MNDVMADLACQYVEKTMIVELGKYVKVLHAHWDVVQIMVALKTWHVLISSVWILVNHRLLVDQLLNVMWQIMLKYVHVQLLWLEMQKLVVAMNQELVLKHLNVQQVIIVMEIFAKQHVESKLFFMLLT